MLKRYSSSALLLFVLHFPFLLPASLAQVREIHVLSGMEAPGTGLTYSSFTKAWLGNNGRILFAAKLSDDTGGVWLLQDGVIQEIIRQGQPLPGVPSKTVGSQATNIVEFDGATFAIWVSTEDGQAIVMGDGQSLSTPAYTGLEAPGTGGLQFFTLGITPRRDHALNNGLLAFYGQSRDSLGTMAHNGIWLTDGGSLSPVAINDGDQFDEVDEWPEVPGHVFDFFDIRLTASGTVYYKAAASQPVATYFFKGTSGSRTEIPLGGNTPGVYDFSADERIALVQQTDAGQLLTLETSAGSGQFEVLAQEGMPATDRDGNATIAQNWALFASSGMGFNEQGELFIDATLVSVNGQNGVWRYGADEKLKLHIGGAYESGSPFIDPTAISFNALGDVFFAEQIALWFQAADGSPAKRIQGRNDTITIDGSERMVNSVFLATSSFSSPGYGGINVSIRPEQAAAAIIRFKDDTSAIVVYSVLAGGMVVNSEGDDGDVSPGDGECQTGGSVGNEPECTLRAALEEVNASDERLTVSFNIPTDAPHVITPASPLPMITKPVTIKGPSHAGTPDLLLDGANTITSPGLSLTAGATGSIVQNLWILSFGAPGIEISGDNFTVANNLLGLDGNQLTGNTIGLKITGNDSQIVDNVISGNASHGVELNGNRNMVMGNVVGLDPAGTEDVGNKGSGLWVSGDANVIAENTISRNSQEGVFITGGAGNILTSNYIGTDGSGKNRLGNLENGIRVEQATGTQIGQAGKGNVLSGNIGAGVALMTGSSQTILDHNMIGVDPTGALGPFNVGAGVRVDQSSDNQIGLSAETPNIIRDNGAGIVVVSGIGNRIRFNQIFGNKGLDIDLGDEDGITANDLGSSSAQPDSDAGANNLLNFPVGIALGVDAEDDAVISGFLDHPNPAGATIDFYSIAEPNEKGVGGGQQWIGSTTPDSSGAILFKPATAPVHPFISATTTDDTGSTSEFSPVCLDPDGDGNPDSDGDSLCDNWEKDGIDYDMDGTVDLVFEAPHAADPMHKDIFVEIDWMKAGSHNHEPLKTGLDQVTAAFSQAPVDNPDNKKGISLHLIKDEATREITPIRMHSGSVDVAPAGDFNDIKFGKPLNPCGTGETDGHFGREQERRSPNCRAILGARKLAYRYVVYGHDHAHFPGSSGVAELPGNDMMVTVGSWSAGSIRATAGIAQGATNHQSRAQALVEAGTLMHEFGHTLNLGHGGGDHENCKPNYISVMNYTLQFPYLVSDRPLDYSTKALPDLNESALNESTGLNGTMGKWLVYNPSTEVSVEASRLRAARANAATIDWTNDGVFENMVSADIDYIASAGCNFQPALRTLQGHNDWANILYNFRSAAAFGDGAVRAPPPSTEPEPTPDTVMDAAMRMDFDNDGLENAIDNCAAIANPGQEDVDMDGIGDVCEEGNADLFIEGIVRNFTDDAGAANQLEHFRMAIYNAGPDTTTALSFADTLMTEASIQNVTASAGSCVASGSVVSCTADELAPMDSLIITFEAELPNGLQAMHTAGVQHGAIDPDPDNNILVRSFTVSSKRPDTPLVHQLYQNYPNPATTSTRIGFDLPAQEQVSLKLYDVLGRVVLDLVDSPLPAGHHEVVASTGNLASGMYFYRLSAGGQQFVKQLVLVK